MFGPQHIDTIGGSKENMRRLYKYSILFILANAVFMYYELYYMALLPMVVAVSVFTLVSLDKVLLLIVFCVPLSVPLRELVPNLEVDFYLPTEPLLFGILLLFILKVLTEKNFDRKITYHPMSWVVYFNLFWIFVTSVSSSMPIVSFKFLLARMWFVAAFYFLATQLFKKASNIKVYVWMYIIPFIIVIGYTINRHLQIGLFDEDAAHYVMSPFYNDHTSYGAMLAMFIPFLLGLAFNSRYKQTVKFLVVVVLAIFLIAIGFSYTRAAWLSLTGAFGVWVLIKLRIKFKYVAFLGIGLIAILFAFQTEIMLELNQNKQDSSRDIEEHIQSMANIRTDASNLERLNRWNCAFRMFAEKPFFGWGPGTYMFEYAGFQFSYEKTIISTNAGDMGNAHSEYIGPLAESGVLGPVSFLLILIFSLYTGIKVYYRLEDKELKMIAISAVLGLVTYYLHGFLNNFLDTDKASAPFWGFIAIIVALDVYHTKKEDSSKTLSAEPLTEEQPS